MRRNTPRMEVVTSSMPVDLSKIVRVKNEQDCLVIFADDKAGGLRPIMRVYPQPHQTYDDTENYTLLMLSALTTQKFSWVKGTFTGWQRDGYAPSEASK